MQTATSSADNTTLLITMNRDISALIERTENLQDDMRELKEEFVRHSKATERSRDKLNFLRGEWKMVVLAIGLVVEHFWNAARVAH